MGTSLVCPGWLAALEMSVRRPATFLLFPILLTVIYSVLSFKLLDKAVGLLPAVKENIRVTVPLWISAVFLASYVLISALRALNFLNSRHLLIS